MRNSLQVKPPLEANFSYCPRASRVNRAYNLKAPAKDTTSLPLSGLLASAKLAPQSGKFIAVKTTVDAGPMLNLPYADKRCTLGKASLV
jgi:hypothetical protein